MVTVWEHFVLIGQVRATTVDQINAGQMAFRCDFLRAQMFFDRHGVICAPFDRGIIAHDHTIRTVYAPDPCDNPSCGGGIIIHIMRRRCPDFQKR